MLKRKMEKKINEWIANDDKAILVYGVRQSGKTYIIRKCLKDRGCDYVEFNLIEQPQIVRIIAESSDVDDMILKLSLYSEKKMIPGKTVIFFDEIQKYKEVVTKIKFLVEDRRYRYVMSGSLFGIEITNLKSAPVGYLKTLKMYPLDFEEFLQLFNMTDEILELLKSSFINRRPIDEIVHNKMLELFNLYIIIGGMPAAVEVYRKTGNIDNVIDVHNSIMEQYKLDFTQYEEENKKLILTNIYELIAAELNEKNKRFKIADISKNLRYERMTDSFTWLWEAGVALPVFNTTEPVLPLMLNKKNSLFKLFLSDVGMLTTIYGKATKLMIVNKEKDINKGGIYENVVAQELASHGISVYYYSSKKQGEIDFVIEYNSLILPIEVKSGKDYEKHSALNNVINIDNYQIKKAVVFSNNNILVDQNIIYLPIYMIMFFNENELEFADISIERFKFSDSHVQ